MIIALLMREPKGKMLVVCAFLLALFSHPLLASVDTRGLKLASPTPVVTPFINKGSYRALIIGNNAYRDPKEIWNPLKTAVNDAEAVARLLTDNYGFKEVILLKDASRRDILKGFSSIAENSGEDDSVLIYYAGHGYLDDKTSEGFWIPVDAEGKDDSTFIRNSTIKSKLEVLSGKVKHALLISDSCFSGSLLRSGNRGISLDQKNERYFSWVAEKKSVQILAAGGLEFVDDNYKNSGHSPFTYFLLNELNTNKDGFLETTELSTNVAKTVSQNTVQIPEKGVLHGAGHEGGEFFFVSDQYKRGAEGGLATNESEQSVAMLSMPPDLPAGVVNKSPFDNMVKISSGNAVIGQAHRSIYLDPYYIDKFEVSNREYQRCVDSEKCKPSLYARISRYNADDKPIVGIDWEDADSYCSFVGKRLPTESEWEWAARNSSKETPIELPVERLNLIAWYRENSDVKNPVRLRGSREASPLGLHDMLGNVEEWVSDWYDFDYYLNLEGDNPKGPESGNKRVFRGGSFATETNNLTPVNRGFEFPTKRKKSLGFRCAVSVR